MRDEQGNPVWQESAQKICAWLDVRYPGWYEWIDTDTLNMQDSCRCLGGQILGHYTEDGRVGYQVITQEMKDDVGDDSDWCFAGEDQTPFIIEEIEKRRVAAPEKVLA